MEDITNIRRELKERGQVFRITRGVSKLSHAFLFIYIGGVAKMAGD